MKEDTIGYAEIIREVFPSALIESVSNFDDENFGWEICPTTRTLIVFKVRMSNPLMLGINSYTINTWEEKTPQTRIFNGHLPPTADAEPDFEFLKTLLKNYRSIG